MTPHKIQSAAFRALKWHSSKPKISIHIKDGGLILEGEVEEEFQKTAASYMLKHLESECRITNNIKIILPKKTTRKSLRAKKSCFSL